jgi:hypothetical protein
MKVKIYILVNAIIAGIIPAIFLFSLMFSSGQENNSTNCIHRALLGASCPVCGMPDGFSAILKGRISEAFIIQPNSIRVFVFLVLVMIMRITSILLLIKTHISLKYIFTSDIILSVFLFIITFKSIIPQVFYIYYKMLITGSNTGVISVIVQFH